MLEEEIHRYRGLPSTITSVNRVAWWWNARDYIPMLPDLATMYLCVQASSTPSERTLSTAGGTISQERACLCLEKADIDVDLSEERLLSKKYVAVNIRLICNLFTSVFLHSKLFVVFSGTKTA